MPRTIQLDLAVDTSFYTALQLQPRVLLAHAWNALATWYRAHLVPFRELIRDHRLGTVILAFEIRYLDQLQFFDSDTLTVEAGLTLRRQASRMQLDVDFAAAGRRGAAVKIIFCPVEIVEERSLSASPAPLGPDLVRLFQADEVDDSAPARTLPGLLEGLISMGAPVAEAQRPFTIAHHHCEVAEQWAFIEVPALTEEAREALAVERCAASPELKRCLDRPLAAIDVELYRPYFIFQPGLVTTRALTTASQLAFVHELRSGDGREKHGTVVERYF